MNRPEPAGEGPVFAAPWEAQAFAMVVALQERGLLTAAEWADRLGAELARAGDGAQDYYGCWLRAAESLITARGWASVDDLATRRDAFDRAARATRHGSPILLANDPMTAAGA